MLIGWNQYFVGADEPGNASSECSTSNKMDLLGTVVQSVRISQIVRIPTINYAQK